jgi:SAM-dependent methyltransferase
MHDTAYHIGRLAMEIYCSRTPARVLEIGSMNVNGALRDHKTSEMEYTGLDIEPGPGVDIVTEPGASLPIPDDSFDLAIASSVFEHDPAFWVTFVEMCRVVRSGGYIYISAPSNGVFHQYPMDHWRFYPDCGIALQGWAKTQGHEIRLVESFVADRQSDIWNDFVAVFHKGAATDDMPQRLMSDDVPCTNVRTWRSKSISKRRELPEDMVLLDGLRHENHRLHDEVRLQADKINFLKQESRQLKDDARALRAQLERLYSSRSWRITAPLRAVARMTAIGHETTYETAPDDMPSPRKALHEFYATHEGYVSDKWSSYFEKYDAAFGHRRDQPIRLLEIGVQNGGSLEIWSKYFSKAKEIIGLDADPACRDLRYDDPRISVLVGDATSDEVVDELNANGRSFDIIIDDGSHTSTDIIRAFVKHFRSLSNGGIYVIEDLCCSYWQSHEGGLDSPYSSIAFFKRLIDVINHEHWGAHISRASALSAFAAKYDLQFDEDALASVHSVEFVNSLCLIRRQAPVRNGLGKRKVSGKKATVFAGVVLEDGQQLRCPDERQTPFIHGNRDDL